MVLAVQVRNTVPADYQHLLEASRWIHAFVKYALAAILLNRLRQVAPSGRRMRDLLSLTVSFRLASGLALLLQQAFQHQGDRFIFATGEFMLSWRVRRATQDAPNPALLVAKSWSVR